MTFFNGMLLLVSFIFGLMMLVLPLDLQKKYKILSPNAGTTKGARIMGGLIVVLSIIIFTALVVL